MTRILCIIGVLTLSFSASTNLGSAAADETVRWKSVGDWYVGVDTTVGYGCFLMAEYKEGSVLRIGFDKSNGGGYLFVANERWESIEIGKDYGLVLEFDNKGAWDAPATGFAFEGSEHPFLYVQFYESDFLTEFMSSHNLNVEYQREKIATLSLRGSYKAAQEMLNCQKQIDETRSSRQSRRDDPFSTNRVRDSNRDPFSR